MAKQSRYTPEHGDTICQLVAEGKTLRQIEAEMAIPLGTLLRWIGNGHENKTGDGRSLTEQYARARDIASDLLETDIMTAAYAASPETAAADRVKIDALKWVAARRAPKRYGDRVHQEVSGPDGGPLAIQAIERRIVDDRSKD
jgi:hypothetical protein